MSVRSMAFMEVRTLPVRIGGGVEVFSRLLARMVNARAIDMVTGDCGPR